jgi:hypothetical protein
MNTSRLEQLTFKIIFQIILNNLEFNVPMTFYALSTLRSIPYNVMQDMFYQITATNGQVKQTVTLYSNQPYTLRTMLNTIPVMRLFFSLDKRPIRYRSVKTTSRLFFYRLKSVRRDFMPYVVRNNLITRTSHMIRLRFTSLKVGNETLLIHRKIKDIYFHFPENFDMPFFYSNLFEAMISASKSDISPQPLFIDDDNHVEAESMNELHLSFTYKCPSCKSNIFDYNGLSQKSMKDFNGKSEIIRILCKCGLCTKKIYCESMK